MDRNTVPLILRADEIGRIVSGDERSSE